MPQLFFAALGIAGLWLAARAVRSLSENRPDATAMDKDGRKPAVTLREDPKTGIYRPED